MSIRLNISRIGIEIFYVIYNKDQIRLLMKMNIINEQVMLIHLNYIKKYINTYLVI